MLQQVLLIEAPHLLFPFARRIIADAVRDGGMPPLMIEPIDFVALYRSKQGAAAADAQPASQATPSSQFQSGVLAEFLGDEGCVRCDLRPR